MTVNDKISDYITFPITFESYVWYKPIIVFILANIVMFVIGGANVNCWFFNLWV